LKCGGTGLSAPVRQSQGRVGGVTPAGFFSERHNGGIHDPRVEGRRVPAAYRVGFGDRLAEMGDGVAQRRRIVTIGQYDQFGKRRDQDTTQRHATEPRFKPSPADSFRKVLRNHRGLIGFNIWRRECGQEWEIFSTGISYGQCATLPQSISRMSSLDEICAE
jgi:hypothetical protein